MPCHCGCNQPAKRNFLPGHDQKLRSSLKKQVGGLLNLNLLLERTRAYTQGQIEAQDLKQEAAKLFSQGTS